MASNWREADSLELNRLSTQNMDLKEILIQDQNKSTTRKHPKLKVQLLSRKTSANPSPQHVETSKTLHEAPKVRTVQEALVPILIQQEKKILEEEKDQQDDALAVKGMSYGKNERKPPCAPKSNLRLCGAKVKTKTSSQKLAYSELSNQRASDSLLACDNMCCTGKTFGKKHQQHGNVYRMSSNQMRQSSLQSGKSSLNNQNVHLGKYEEVVQRAETDAFQKELDMLIDQRKSEKSRRNSLLIRRQSRSPKLNIDEIIQNEDMLKPASVQ